MEIYMKIKALFSLIIMALAPATFAMQMPPKSAQEAATVKTTVTAEDQCPVCQETAANTVQNELKITNCCQNFICASCENGIIQNARNIAAQNQTPEQRNLFANQHGFEPRNQLKANCPLCRKDLDTRAAKLLTQTESLEIIDVNGTKFNLDPELSQALLQCTNLEALEAHPGILDFSGLNHGKRGFLRKEFITRVAEWINNPKYQQSKFTPRLEIFETAHYLGAPDNILYMLANELWPSMQDNSNNNELNKEYKKHVRSLARSHLSSPKHFLRYLQSKPANYASILKTQFMGGNLMDPQSGIQLDFDSLKIFMQTLRDTGWYTHNNADWYIQYPFCSLDGLIDLLKYLDMKSDSFLRQSLNLSNHSIENFSCDFIEYIDILNLSNNNIQKLTGNQLKRKCALPAKLILTNNPINTIEESFFEALRKERATKYNSCEISLENNKLTAAQKEEVRKKFYKATNTVPQRYFNCEMFGNAFVYGGCLAGIAGALYACNKLADYAPQFTKSLSVGLATGIGGIIGASREFLRGPSHSGKWLLFDVAAGATGAYFGAHKIFEKQPALAKVLPMAFAGLTGSVTGYFAGWQAGTITANGLAKLSHPEISWKNQNWANGDYTLKL